MYLVSSELAFAKIANSNVKFMSKLMAGQNKTWLLCSNYCLYLAKYCL